MSNHNYKMEWELEQKWRLAAEATITSLTKAINNCITEASQKNDPVYPLVTIYQHRHSKIINILKAALKEQTDD